MVSKSNKDRQADLKERYRSQGLVQRTYWVTPEQDLQIRLLLETPEARKKREDDEAREQLEQIVKANQAQIQERLNAGDKPTAIAAWLREAFGWKGSGATLNGLIPRR